jgi:CheY-specific phosphatase CheX
MGQENVTRSIAEIASEGELADVVSQAVVETFNRMFGQDLLAGKKEVSTPDNVVMTFVKLSHNNRDVAFCFRFDTQLLLLAAQAIFTPEYIKTNPVVEDIACEIANIVGNKVKNYLKQEGYYTDMSFPFLASAEEAEKLAGQKHLPIHFFYTDKGEKPGIGVAVDFIVI